MQPYQASQLALAKETVMLLKQHIKQARLKKTDKLENYIEYIKRIGKQLPQGTSEFTVPNVIRRIVAIIRERSTEEGLVQGKSLHERQFKELKDAITRGEYKSKPIEEQEVATGASTIRRSISNVQEKEDLIQDKTIINNFIIPALDTMAEELDSNQELINDYASQHFFSNEVIMVYEYSTTVLQFLLQAKKVRNLEVIVVQNETSNHGHIMSQELAKHDLNVALIPFTNACALMQRVSKVLLGVDAVFKNGGLLMHPGTYMLCLAAKQFSVPVIALAGIHKLTPKYAFEQNTFNELLSPLEICPDADGSRNTFIGVRYDYVPPEYITLYITNLGQFTPENIYQMFNDFYDHRDEDY